MSSPIRVSKIMADRGICSRREADRLIDQGLVSVDGQPAQLGQKANPDCVIEVLQEGAQWLHDQVTIVINKPVGFVSAQAEKDYKPAITLIDKDSQWKRSKPFKREHLQNLAPAGRLDIDSKGLLILTQDGVVAKKIIGEDSKLSKEYIVKVEGSLTESKIKTLCFGLELDGQKLKKADVEEIRPMLLKFILLEGKKRQIRRMCEAVGLKVLSLKRIRVGPIHLGELPDGQWRYLSSEERSKVLSSQND